MIIGRKGLWYCLSWWQRNNPLVVFLKLGPIFLSVAAHGEFDNVISLENEVSTSQQIEVRGVIQARNHATLASTISAQIIELPVLEGMSFQKGQRLALFDCRKPLADVKAAQASVLIQQQKVDANKEMASFNAISEYEVVVSEAELTKAIAEKESLDSHVSGCEIRAPYDGSVVENLVNRYEVVAANEPILSIVDVTHLEVSIIVPSYWLRWLKVNSQFLFSVDEVKQNLHVKVSRISPTIDPVSRTVKVIGEFSTKENRVTDVLPGMSGSARFNERG